MDIQKFRKRLRIFLRSELSLKNVVSNPKKYKKLFKGFNDKSIGIYDFENNFLNDYLSDYARLKTMWVNGPYVQVLLNKLIFEATCRGSLPVSENIALIDNGNISSIGNYNVNSFKELINYLKHNKAMVIKPITGSGGAGILNVRYNVENQITLNGEKITSDKLEKLVSTLKDNFVNEYISQGKFGDELYQGSMNTVRIITMQDPDTGEVFIPAAAYRIGSKKSHPTDAWFQGGLACSIDVETGELSKGVILPDENKELTWHDKHPDTGVQIEGRVIPHWQVIKKQILKGVNKLPFLKYVGWDIIVTDNGFRIIEGNSMSDVNLLQVHEPLLKDKRVRRFYEYHNVL